MRRIKDGDACFRQREQHRQRSGAEHGLRALRELPSPWAAAGKWAQVTRFLPRGWPLAQPGWCPEAWLLTNHSPRPAPAGPLSQVFGPCFSGSEAALEQRAPLELGCSHSRSRAKGSQAPATAGQCLLTPRRGDLLCSTPSGCQVLTR